MSSDRPPTPPARAASPGTPPPDRVLAETRFLRLIDRGGWYFVERPGLSGVVTLVALTDAGELLLVEQPRAPLRGRTIELPAGLAGDDAHTRGEPLVEAARRELLEETGYAARSIVPLADCPTSAGMTNEIVSFFLCTGLDRVGPGGGVDGEDIQVHRVPLEDVDGFLAGQAAAGKYVAAKVYAGLYFAHRARREQVEAPSQAGSPAAANREVAPR